MMNRASNNIAFVGPISCNGEAPRGGYQACNQRTIKALRARGVDVAVFRYPEPSGNVFSKGVNYFLGFIKLGWRLLWAHEKIIHLTGLYKHFIYPELLLVILARVKDCNIIYDIRAGSARKHYDQRTLIYRWAFRKTLKLARIVMVEGAEYIDFVNSIVGNNPFLLPNHVSILIGENVNRHDPSCTGHVVSLTYIGRLVTNKGIEIVLQAAAILRRRGFSVHLRMAGDGGLSYVSMLKKRYSDPNNEWLGVLSSFAVLDLFATSHFFLFPTTHPGEGQSNALTESMAAGCVPIASLNGFNQSVIGGCGKVLQKGADATAYADAVQEILHKKQWGMLSAHAILRARECFDTDRVVDSLVDQYKQLGELNATDSGRGFHLAE